jgi:hypothetical protein
MTPRNVGLRADDAVASHRAVGGAGHSIKRARTCARGISRGAVAVLRAHRPRHFASKFFSDLAHRPTNVIANVSHVSHDLQLKICGRGLLWNSPIASRQKRGSRDAMDAGSKLCRPQKKKVSFSQRGRGAVAWQLLGLGPLVARPSFALGSIGRCRRRFWWRVRVQYRTYVLEGKPKLLSVSATRRPSVRADPQGMQPG